MLKSMSLKFVALSVFASASIMSAPAVLAEEGQVTISQQITGAEGAESFSGRVIGLIACNNNKNVILTLHEESTDEIASFATDAAKNGVLNPILARAYVSVGKAEKPILSVTFEPEYSGESCGSDVKGYWTGYVK